MLGKLQEISKEIQLHGLTLWEIWVKLFEHVRHIQWGLGTNAAEKCSCTMCSSHSIFMQQ